MGVATSCCGTGALYKKDGIMRKEDYAWILKQHLKASAREGRVWAKKVFPNGQWPEADYLHVSKVAEGEQSLESGLEWPSQRSHLNPGGRAEKWNKAAYKPGSVTPAQEWAPIPADWCEKLVEAHPKHLTRVIHFKGNATKCHRNVWKLLTLRKVIIIEFSLSLFI